MESEKITTYYTYILRCADGTLYSGYTTDPRRRTALHNSGKGAKCTCSRRPMDLIFVESHLTKSEVLRHGAALKKLSRARGLLLIEQTNSRTEAADGNG